MPKTPTIVKEIQLAPVKELDYSYQKNISYYYLCECENLPFGLKYKNIIGILISFLVRKPSKVKQTSYVANQHM